MMQELHSNISYRHQHALAFHDGSTAAKESNDENQNTGWDEQNCSTQHVVARGQRCIGALWHLQPNANAKDCTAQ